MRINYPLSLASMLRQARTGQLLFFIVLAAIAVTIAGPGIKLMRPTQAATTRCVNPGGTGGCFSSVQAAVNASLAGETINIAAGTYIEQIKINKRLTIKGAGLGLTTIKPIIPFPTTSIDSGFIIELSNAAVVKLSKLTVAGPKDTATYGLDCNYANALDIGIVVIGGATLNLSNASVEDIRDNPLSGCQTGIAIFIGASSAFITRPQSQSRWRHAQRLPEGGWSLRTLVPP